MEKQKIFWVILSVTVLVVVVLVVGLFLLKGRPDGLASAAEPSSTAGSSTGIYEFGRDASSAEGDTEVLRFVIGDGGEGASADDGQDAAVSDAAASDADSAAGSDPAGSAASAAEKPAATAAVAAKPAAAAPTKSATASTAATATTAAATRSAATATTAAAIRANEYWIQTGSYQSQSRAEELSQSLAAKGLAGRVFSFDNKGETYFRVRIGPYGDRQEADKFLAIVKKIQGLEASYISLVPTTRSAN